MKILFIGGTGTISTDVSRLLLQEGHELYLLNRGNKNDSLPSGAKPLVANVHDETAVLKLIEEHTFDAVVDFIAYTPGDVQRDIRIFAGKTRQYVFISSAAAYQKPPTHPVITESTPLANPYWQYARDKIACEEALMAAYRETGFPVTIVRPSHTYNHRKIPVALHGAKGSWQVMQRMLDGKPVLLHADGASLWTFTHSSDFARAFIGLLGNPHALGEAVHITSDECLTWNQAYQIIADILGVSAHIVHAPTWLLSQAGKPYGYDVTGNLLGDKGNTMLFDNSKIKRLVPGWHAKKRFDEGVRESIETFRAAPSLQEADPVFDEFCDKVVAALKSAQQGLAVPGC